MMKLLHSADWHLDSPFTGRSPELARYLREESRKLPERVVTAARENGCQLLLLAGDLFDGPCSQESLVAVRQALAGAGMPVFIAPGNHDPYTAGSVWHRAQWPENVHIFTGPAMESVPLPELDCRIYGAAFTGPEAPSLLDGFQARQAEGSGLDYLALGHIHKRDLFRAGRTLCAWPGCPMGRGFDELEPKGVLLVTVEEAAKAEFLPLDTPAFYDLEAEAGDDPAATLAGLLPPAGGRDVFRVTFTGECAGLDLAALAAAFSQFPHLELRDRTVPLLDPWGAAGDDTLEGVYFSLLQQAARDPEKCASAELAARISRRLLNGWEVPLP